MKDYYKILGVEEEASEEEIRQRWIELTQKDQPDLRKGLGGEERIKEIEEAYQVLGNGSKRMEYDLERDLKRSILKKIHPPKDRIFRPQRLFLPISVFIVLIILGSFFFLRRAQIPPHDSVTAPISTISPKVRDERDTFEKEREIISPPPLSLARERGVKTEEKPSMKSHSKSETPIRIEKVVPQETDKTSLQESPKIVTQAPKPEMPVKDEKPVFLPPPSFAKEGDIREFFSNYVDRYIYKDIDGFLSFFSPKAIQNQKEGFDEIRNIYINFFRQSEELLNQLEGIKIEIYENGAEVKARYQVDQTLKKGKTMKVWKGHIRWILTKEEGALKILSIDYQLHNP